MARTFMMKPGLQKPHCSAPSWARKRPKASASFSTPSRVVTSRPSALAASTEQESTGVPSSQTVHRPQFEVSQPLFTL